MSGTRRRWPTGAKVTVAALCAVLLLIIGLREPTSSAEPDEQTTRHPVTTTTLAPREAPGSTATGPTTTGRDTEPPPATTALAAAPTTIAAPASTPVPLPPPAAPPTPPAGDLARLDALPVGMLDRTLPYDRTAFGPAWADVDHNGCDTRNDILRRDLTNLSTRPGTHDCVIIAGTLWDPYTGTTMAFEKANASAVQIDHLIPLHAAWQLGAWSWSAEQRRQYANDPVVLLAVNGRQNQSKSDRLADAWKPPNQGWWCEYARRTVVVHERYALPVTPTERGALAEMLGTCR